MPPRGARVRIQVNWLKRHLAGLVGTPPDALAQIQPGACLDESGFLNVFDSNRDLIAPPRPGFTFAAAKVLMIWLPLIFENMRLGPLGLYLPNNPVPVEGNDPSAGAGRAGVVSGNGAGTADRRSVRL